MSMDELRKLRDSLASLERDMPKMVTELLVGEGTYCVRQYRRILTDEDKIDTGYLRMNAHCGDKNRGALSAALYDNSPPRVSNSAYEIDIYNNAEYASFVEMGFRSHWVPAKYLSPKLLAKIYNAQKEVASKEGKASPQTIPMGMYVGPKNGYVPGVWALKRAVERTEAAQAPRLQRRMNKILKERMEGKE